MRGWVLASKQNMHAFMCVCVSPLQEVDNGGPGDVEFTAPKVENGGGGGGGGGTLTNGHAKKHAVRRCST